MKLKYAGGALLAIILAVVVGFIAAFKQTPTPIPAAAAAPAFIPKTTPVTFIPKSAATESGNESVAGTAPPQFEIHFIKASVQHLAELGLQPFFDQSLLTNVQNDVLDAIETNSYASKIVSDTYAAQLDPESATKLLASLKSSRKAEISGQFDISPTFGSESSVSSSTALSLAVSVNTNSFTAAYNIGKYEMGMSLNLRVLPSSAPGEMVIEAGVMFHEFNGYLESTQEYKFPSGEVVKVPKPQIALAAAGTRAEIGMTNALLLGTGTQLNVARSVERVKYLSDIPLLAPYFTKQRTFTNYVRTLVLIQAVPGTNPITQR